MSAELASIEQFLELLRGHQELEKLRYANRAFPPLYDDGDVTQRSNLYSYNAGSEKMQNSIFNDLKGTQMRTVYRAHSVLGLRFLMLIGSTSIQWTDFKIWVLDTICV